VLVAVLVAGRSGSAMTAQIGVMRVTEEIDALATMGVSRTLRIVLPKVAALAITMPLLVVWCSAAGILGGMVSANLQMDLSYGFFIDTLPRVVPVANLWIGMGKGFAFGIMIALVACHFGLRVKPNTESLSAMTTKSVVSAITVVILLDAIFAVLTRHIGMPGAA
jgi:phospholipid/cholesterol/gamma-HCH transport system permease protein